MVEGFDPAAFDIVREEFQRDDDERDRLREEERRLSEERDIDRDRLRDERQDSSNFYRPFVLIDGKLVRNPDFVDSTTDPRFDVMEEIVNDDSIVLTPEMVEIINDPKMRMTRRGEVTRLTGRDVIRRSGQFARSAILPDLPIAKTKKKRKVSKYQKEFGKQLKKLKLKHPRTKITKLMKRAHSATRKAMK